MTVRNTSQSAVIGGRAGAKAMLALSAAAAAAAAAASLALAAPLLARADGTPPTPPPPPTTGAQLRLSAAAVQGVAHAGRLVTVDATATDADGAAVNAADVRCLGHIGSKLTPVVHMALSNGRATCVLRIPRGTAGKRLLGAIEISNPDGVATRSFAARISR